MIMGLGKMLLDEYTRTCDEDFWAVAILPCLIGASTAVDST